MPLCFSAHQMRHMGQLKACFSPGNTNKRHTCSGISCPQNDSVRFAIYASVWYFLLLAHPNNTVVIYAPVSVDCEMLYCTACRTILNKLQMFNLKFPLPYWEALCVYCDVWCLCVRIKHHFVYPS